MNMNVPRRVATQDELQTEADRWCEKLKTRGFRLPNTRITVYTSPGKFEAATGETLLEEFVAGRAGFSREGKPVVYVEVFAHPAPDDTIGILIHELLHHAKPALGHDDVYWLARQLRNNPDAPIPTHAHLVQFEDFLHDLWLEANGFQDDGDDDEAVASRKSISQSPLNGRFVRPVRTEKGGREGISGSGNPRHDRPRHRGLEPRDEENRS